MDTFIRKLQDNLSPFAGVPMTEEFDVQILNIVHNLLDEAYSQGHLPNRVHPLWIDKDTIRSLYIIRHGTEDLGTYLINNWAK